MKRSFILVLTAVSFACSAGIISIWVRSYSYSDEFVRDAGSPDGDIQRWTFRSMRGGIKMDHEVLSGNVSPPMPSWYWFCEQVSDNDTLVESKFFAPFGFYIARDSGMFRVRIPYWLLMLICLALQRYFRSTR